MEFKIPEPCLTCGYWRRVSKSYVLYCCHCLLDSNKRHGLNKEKTFCTTWREKAEEDDEI